MSNINVKFRLVTNTGVLSKEFSQALKKVKQDLENHMKDLISNQIGDRPRKSVINIHHSDLRDARIGVVCREHTASVYFNSVMFQGGNMEFLIEHEIMHAIFGMSAITRKYVIKLEMESNADDVSPSGSA